MLGPTVHLLLTVLAIAGPAPILRDSVIGGVRFTQVDTTFETSDAATSHVPFTSVARWSAVLDRPDRASWQKPRMVVDSLGLYRGARVADLGAGTGYFDSLLARAVGASGKVYAQEIESTLVSHIAERARRWKTPQVSPILGTPDDPRLPADLDLVFVCDVYRYIDDRRAYFRRLRHSLAPGGRLAIVELKPAFGSETHLSADRIVRELADAGYVLARQLRFLPLQNFLIFRALEN